MSEPTITMTYWECAAICGMWLLVGMAVGSWVWERFGGNAADCDTDEGTHEP